MAFLTAEEFGAAIGVLAEHHGVERLRERLARLNAFTSRRGLNSAPAIADRLFALSGGLRRQVGATFAFTSLSSNFERPSSQLTVQRNGILMPETSR